MFPLVKKDQMFFADRPEATPDWIPLREHFAPNRAEKQLLDSLIDVSRVEGDNVKVPKHAVFYGKQHKWEGMLPPGEAPPSRE